MTGLLRQIARVYLLFSLTVAVPLPVMAGMPAMGGTHTAAMSVAEHDPACESQTQDTHRCCEQACPGQCDMCAMFVTGALPVETGAVIISGPDALSITGLSVPSHLQSRPNLRPPRLAA